MLTHPTLDQLTPVGLPAWPRLSPNSTANDEAASLSHAEWLALLLDREATHRSDKRLARGCAMPDCDIRLRPRTSITAPRAVSTARSSESLSRAIGSRRTTTCVIIGPTGVGKSWLACAIGHKACRDNRSVLYPRAPKLFDELALAHGDGSATAASRASAPSIS